MPHLTRMPDVIPHPEPGELESDLAWMEALAMLWFGLRWQAVFSGATGIAPGHLSDMLREKREPGPIVKAKFLKWLASEEAKVLDEAHYRLRMIDHCRRRMDSS